MLVVIRRLKNQRHLLEDTKYKFEIWTDHKNLEYFMKVQKLNYRQVQWVLYLSRFDFTLKHVLATKMRKADGLSRRLDWKVEVEKDNENQKNNKRRMGLKTSRSSSGRTGSRYNRKNKNG